MSKPRSRHRRGFTLVELLVAIAMHNYDDQWGACPIGANVALTDGSVRFIGESVDYTLLTNLANRNDGNEISDF